MYLPSTCLDLRLLQLSRDLLLFSLVPSLFGSQDSKHDLKACHKSATWSYRECTDSFPTGTVLALARQFFPPLLPAHHWFHMTVAAQLADKRVCTGSDGCHSYIHTAPAIQTRQNDALQNTVRKL